MNGQQLNGSAGPDFYSVTDNYCYLFEHFLIDFAAF